MSRDLLKGDVFLEELKNITCDLGMECKFFTENEARKVKNKVSVYLYDDENGLLDENGRDLFIKVQDKGKSQYSEGVDIIVSKRIYRFKDSVEEKDRMAKAFVSSFCGEVFCRGSDIVGVDWLKNIDNIEKTYYQSKYKSMYKSVITSWTIHNRFIEKISIENYLKNYFLGDFDSYILNDIKKYLSENELYFSAKSIGGIEPKILDRILKNAQFDNPDKKIISYNYNYDIIEGGNGEAINLTCGTFYDAGLRLDEYIDGFFEGTIKLNKRTNRKSVKAFEGQDDKIAGRISGDSFYFQHCGGSDEGYEKYFGHFLNGRNKLSGCVDVKISKEMAEKENIYPYLQRQSGSINVALNSVDVSGLRKLIDRCINDVLLVFNFRLLGYEEKIKNKLLSNDDYFNFLNKNSHRVFNENKLDGFKVIELNFLKRFEQCKKLIHFDLHSTNGSGSIPFSFNHKYNNQKITLDKIIDNKENLPKEGDFVLNVSIRFFENGFSEDLFKEKIAHEFMHGIVKNKYSYLVEYLLVLNEGIKGDNLYHEYDSIKKMIKSEFKEVPFDKEFQYEYTQYESKKNNDDKEEPKRIWARMAINEGFAVAMEFFMHKHLKGDIVSLEKFVYERYAKKHGDKAKAYTKGVAFLKKEGWIDEDEGMDMDKFYYKLAEVVLCIHRGSVKRLNGQVISISKEEKAILLNEIKASANR